MKITSSAFTEGSAIPSRYTCDGDDTPPPLAWSGVPREAASLALIVDDPDAPDPAAPQRVWVHWVLYNIPPDVAGLPESGRMPGEAQDGLNDWKRSGYGGPCPPVGNHRYFFKLYALDTVLQMQGTPTKAQLEKAMHGHILAQAVLMGTYQR